MEEAEIRCVAGLYLANDISIGNVQFLGAICIPKNVVNCEDMRDVVSSSWLQLTDRKSNSGFVFLTQAGWEVRKDMEKLLKIEDVLFNGNVIKLRLKDGEQRVGMIIVSDSGADTPMGYICIPNGQTATNVSHIRQLIDQQLPALHKQLQEQNIQFLDHNGWPLTPAQEDKLMIMQVLQENTIRMKAWPNSILVTPGPSPVPTSAMEIPKIETPATFSSSSSPLTLTPFPASSNSYSSLPRNGISSKPFDIVISYVHKETTKIASLLCDELQRLNYTTFLDTQYIKAGSDWQDVLNEAIYSCSVFVPLISDQYGLTEWTNKEVKLADTLDKFIIPINFIPSWPPMCLAIQFATTQYILWGKNASNIIDQRTVASKVAAEISERYKVVKEHRKQQEMIEDQEKVDEPTKKGDRDEEDKLTIKNGSGKMRRFSAAIRKSLMKKDSILNLITISHHSKKQLELIAGMKSHLEGRGYEVWISSAGTDSQRRQKFKEKVNEAGVVIFLLSQDFSEAEWCEQEVYYCEGRKRIIPVVVETFEMPCWMSILIGNETFLDCRSNTFYDILTEEVECATLPSKMEGRLRKLVEQKTNLHKMCKQVEQNLPMGRLVYVSGSTKFFSHNGEEVSIELGKHLARDRNIVLVTGGFYGVGETVGRSFYEERKKLGWDDGVVHIQAVKDDRDRSTHTRQNSDGTFQPVPYGKTIFIGNSVRQREMITARSLDLCLLIEGGPGAAFEAHQFSWNDHTVIPIKVTGGAAGGKFNVPQTIFIKPAHVSDTEWTMLQDKKASPTDIAKAVASIVAMK